MFRLLQLSVVMIAVSASACERKPPAPAAPKIIQAGAASFYGDEFAGQKTASGEALKLDEMTAASRTLPLGTHVEVENTETGQSAKVRINDRGPYAEGRVIDLTPKAAQHIGLDREKGVAQVIIKPATLPRSDVE